ncbi:MAG TPA: hypothetical protein VKV96_06620 [Roseiarcus sp.]|nr:hypothetical protein [Roseiarcus sp.]
MAAVVGSTWFQVGVIPLALMIVGVFANQLGRRDGDDSPRRNDWAVNTTLLLMVLGTILGDLGEKQQQVGELLNLLGWLIGVLVAAFASLSYDRYGSWERDQAGLPLKSKRWWGGIIGPDIAALIIFAAFQAHKVKLI